MARPLNGLCLQYNAVRIKVSILFLRKLIFFSTIFISFINKELPNKRLSPAWKIFLRSSCSKQSCTKCKICSLKEKSFYFKCISVMFFERKVKKEDIFTICKNQIKKDTLHISFLKPFQTTVTATTFSDRIFII